MQAKTNVQWKLHKTEEQPFGRYREVVFVERFQIPTTCKFLVYSQLMNYEKSVMLYKLGYTIITCTLRAYTVRDNSTDTLVHHSLQCAVAIILTSTNHNLWKMQKQCNLTLLYVPLYNYSASTGQINQMYQVQCSLFYYKPALLELIQHPAHQ